jgi:hypothetical protein
VGDLFDGAANLVTERIGVFPGGQRDVQLFGAEASGGGRCVAGDRRVCGRRIRIFGVAGERVALLEKLRGQRLRRVVLRDELLAAAAQGTEGPEFADE